MCKERMAGRFLHRHAGLVLHTSDGCSCKLLAVIVHKGFGFTSFWRRKKELGTPPVPGGAVAGSSTMCTGHAACCKTDRGGLPDHFLLLSHMEWKHEQVIAPEITVFFLSAMQIQMPAPLRKSLGQPSCLTQSWSTVTAVPVPQHCWAPMAAAVGTARRATVSPLRDVGYPKGEGKWGM